MQWSQIKTIFILCFLVLNIYLIVQYFDKRDQSDVNVLQREESTIEDQLKAENITYKDLPDENLEESFISVEQKQFDESEIRKLNNLKNQRTTTVINKSIIISQFDQPVGVTEDHTSSEIEQLVADTFIYSDDYIFWDWNKELNVLVFFQEKMDRPIYFNSSGLVLIFLDDQDEMTFYIQTMLGEAESRRERESLIEPIQAIETLYNNNELQSGDDITQVDIGFHTRVPLDDGIQVFVPTWKVTVNDDKRYFVNAMEGFIFSSDEKAFIKEFINSMIDRIKLLEDEEILKENILSILEAKQKE